MEPIIAPITRNSRGDAVVNLQDGLLLLISRGIFKLEDNTLRAYLVGLRNEQKEQVYGNTTAKSVAHFQTQFRLTATGEIDSATAKTLNQTLKRLEATDSQPLPQPPRPIYRVSGSVLNLDKLPVSDVTVEAFDKGLRRRSSLGTATTDAVGHYAIAYNRDQFLDPKRSNAHLLIEVRGKQNILATSPVKVNARQREQIDLVVKPATVETLSEFERLEQQLIPQLEETRPTELTEDDLAFLAKTTRLPQEQLADYQQAATATSRTQLPIALHYGLLREGFPAHLEGLSQLSRLRLEQALNSLKTTSLIPRPSDAEITALSTQAEILSLDRQLATPLSRSQTTLKQVLDAANVDTTQQRLIAKKLENRLIQDSSLWDELQQDNSLEEKTVQRAKFAVQVGTWVRGHIPTLQALQNNNRIESQRELAKQYATLDSWQQLIATTTENNLPNDLEGETSADRRANFAQQLHEKVAAAYPTVTMAYGLSGQRELVAKYKNLPLLTRLVDNDEGFDLASVRLDSYLKARRGDFGIPEADQAEVANDLKRVQRLYRLKPDLAVVSRLLKDHDERENKLDSAIAIVHKGRGKFLAEYSRDDVFGRDTAIALYQQAQKVAAKAFGLYAHFSPAINTSPLPVAIRSECPAELKGVPNYPTLFGSLDGCYCEPCESVYSPAAYLTDLLAFLERDVEPIPNYFENSDLVVENGLEALKARFFCNRDNQLVSQPRRPDITQTLLSCRNAETEIPYIDLTLEILENAIAPRSNPDTLQTTLPAHQLAAQPEHLNPEAYEILARAVFPLNLPFDLWHEEETIYLTQLGTSRAELLETFYPFQGNDASNNDPHDWTDIRRWQASRIAQARLGLNDVAWQIISDQSSSPQQSAGEFWGFSFVLDRDWQAELANVDTFLQRSELNYNDLLRLLRLKSVNPTGAIAIREDGLAACDPQKQTLQGLTSEALDFLHRFLRLQKLLGWTLQEMDQALMSLSPPSSSDARPTLDENGLIRLSHLNYLQARFKLPLVELLSWWAKLDTQDYRIPQLPHDNTAASLYASLFLTGRPGEAEFDTFKLNQELTELQNTNTDLSNYLSSVAGALRLAQPDLSNLIEALNQTLDNNGDNTPIQLNLETLSWLYRHQSLARSLGLTIEDYLTLKDLIGFDPFGPIVLTNNEPLGATLQTLRFVERAEVVKASGFAIAELDYLLHQITPFPLKTLAPTEEWIQQSLETLQNSVALLGDNVPNEIRQETLNVSLADVLSLPTNTTKVLLEKIVLPADPTQTASEAFLSTQAFQPSLAELLYRLHKAALFINRLGIRAQDLWNSDGAPSYLSLSSAAGWLDLNVLPVRENEAIAPFDNWMRTFKLFQLRDALLPEHQEHWFDLFEQPEPPQPGTVPIDNSQQRQAYAAKLAAFSGWNPEDVLALVGKFDLGTISHGSGGILKAKFPQHFADERLPQRILTAVKRLQTLGTTALDAESWVARPLTPAQRPGQVGQIKNALKARYKESWADVLKPLRDPLREQQRQSLVAYLLHQWQLVRSDDLFDHFLIDVEMSPCMMTSRLIQAIAAVQLFVQRVLMNLEPGLALSDEGSEQWDWMKNYRVWEANRKIFLYPENWIEPELRDDKTPAFKALEEELLQADITNETAETALIHYLENLNEVARLQVCGQYLEIGNPSTLHVFARTRDIPHHYYYRKGILEGVSDAIEIALASEDLETAFAALEPYWTPWEKVDVDIEGDHLIPIVYNRRVYLFWPLFTSEDEAPLTQTFQSLLTLYGQMFQLMITTGELIQNLAQGTGVVVVGGLSNSIIQILFALEEGFNDLIPGEDGAFNPLNLLDQRNKIRSMRSALLGALGVPENASVDNTQLMMDRADLDSFDELQAVFSEVLGYVQDYQDYLLSYLPAKRLDVQMAWSEFKNDSWSAKKTSANLVTFRDVISALFENLPELPGLGRAGVRRLFTFRASVNDYNELFVHCEIALPTSLIDPETYSTEQWLSEPREIGYFRYDTCSGHLEAIDTSEQIDFVDLFTQAASQIVTVAESVVQSMQSDRQLQQKGAPVTPDDDPQRPSAFRALLESFSLPEHVLSPYSVPADIDPYRIVAKHQTTNLLGKLFGFFYQDTKRSYFCVPWHSSNGKSPKVTKGPEFIFFPFYHPYTCALLENIQRGGVPAIYDERYILDAQNRLIPSQSASAQPLQVALQNEQVIALPEYHSVGNVYNPTNGSRALRPIEEFNFSSIGTYAQYNWEIFFHIPLLIATRLSTHQKFNEAQQWFHYIFNPTDASRGSVPNKYWRTRPFVETSQADYSFQDIDSLLQLLNDEAEIPNLQEIERAVRRWRRDAFNPHLVARSRTVAFQKAVVMKYIDNLIAWGDMLFRRETRESINEAMQLYILAAKLLGPRPRRIPKSLKREEKSFEQLNLDALSNALVDFENYLPAIGTALGVGKPSSGSTLIENSGSLDKASLAQVSSAYHQLLRSPSIQHILRKPAAVEDLYFCVPPNHELLEKWEIVADRLFKIRHCQNISGQRLELSLLGSPIDPALLVRAKAAGLEIDDILSQQSLPLPHYRFQVLAQKATELCNEVKSLGTALLSAMEKRDSETLALLRNSHEKRLLEAVKTIKEKQIEEATATLEGLRRSQGATTLRRDRYQQRLSEFMIPEETAHSSLMLLSLILQAYQTGIKWGAVPASLIPNIKGGFVTTLGVTYGGENVGNAASRASDAIGTLASTVGSAASLISTMGTYRRRAEDWQLQIDLTNKELESLEKQIEAADIRVAIAQTDLENHELQTNNSQETLTFMQQKFTHQALYEWMVSKISTLYFQSYQLAYDMARKAQQTLAIELGIESLNIIQYGYWDNLKKGLLAGEQLHHDLKQLEVTYLEKNKREYELTKHISLLQLDPIALLTLKATGSCEVSLPEWSFDLDAPGHYMRRIKNISLSIPSVTGPYTSVNCTLTLIQSKVRTSSVITGAYADDANYTADFISNPSIATSSAQSDNGLFELNFRDERYLPFEYAGAISKWTLELPNKFRQFDYNTITDVILHLSYTARDGGSTLKTESIQNLESVFNSQLSGHEGNRLWQLFSAKHEFPDFAYRFLNGESPTLALDLDQQHFPFYFKDKSLTIYHIDLYLKLQVHTDNSLPQVQLRAPDDSVVVDSQSNATFDFVANASGMYQASIELNSPHTVSESSTWNLNWQGSTTAEIDDILIVCHYQVSNS